MTCRMDVSVVIPTRNRLKSLLRLLESLDAQTYPVREAIVVDASDEPLLQTAWGDLFPSLTIRILHSKPHVCVQRNLGIRTTTGEFIFLCDDDMELPANYVHRLMECFAEDGDVGAVSGLVVEPLPDGRFNDGFHPVSVSTLFFNFVFQLTVWTDVCSMSAPFPASLLLAPLQRFYAVRGNTLTLAGWPLLTNVQRPLMRTAIYGLGGSIIRREWLINTPFDESLDRHGIGDNYGVAIGFPGSMPIAVLTNVEILHHKVPENRLSGSETYLRRVLALDYFMAKNKRFSLLNRFLLRWSLVGNYLGNLFSGQKEMSRAARRALWTLVRNRNPYLLRETCTTLMGTLSIHEGGNEQTGRILH